MDLAPKYLFILKVSCAALKKEDKNEKSSNIHDNEPSRLDRAELPEGKD